MPSEDRVSRRRYDRERRAREEAETLLEERSRELYFLNQKLSEQSASLEREVERRTDELSQALKQAENASTARARFIATMSHEIRTPLGGLLGMIELLKDQETDPNKSQLLGHAKMSGEALRQIVNDVLDLSRIEAGTLAFQHSNVDFRALIESVLTMTGVLIEDSQDRLHCEIDASVPLLFEGDALRIRQLVSNLVTNAARYSVDGPITMRARTIQSSSKTILRVEVEDEGVGLSEEQQPHLFKDFSQIQNDLTDAAQGTGLGLAICKRIIDGLDGQIGVSSKLGDGSTFWFELPIQKVSSQNVDHSISFGDETSRVPVPTEGKKVLLAEDNTINQKVFLGFFKRLGMDADLAKDGVEFLHKFSPEKYDIALLDIAMPKMDGLSAVRQVQAKHPAHAIVPFAFLTAHVVKEVHDECYSLGAQLVVSKPASFDDLTEAVQTLLRSNLQPSTQKRKEPGVFSGDTAEPTAALVAARLMNPSTAKELKATFSAAQISELLDQYLSDGREKLVTISDHLASGRFDLSTQTAHSLKGASGLLGFSEISELAGILEAEAEHLDKDALAEIEGGITRLFDELERAK